jgi:hypothetical protein
MTEREQYLLGQWMWGVENYLREIATKAGIPENRMDKMLAGTRTMLLDLPATPQGSGLTRAQNDALMMITPIGPLRFDPEPPTFPLFPPLTADQVTHLHQVIADSVARKKEIDAGKTIEQQEG